MVAFACLISMLVLIVLDLFMQGLIVSVAWNLIVPTIAMQLFGVEVPELSIVYATAICVFIGLFRSNAYNPNTKGLETEEVAAVLWGLAIYRWMLGWIGVGLLYCVTLFM